MPRMLTIICLGFMLLVPVQASASVEQGVLAYQQGNYEAALAAFEPEALAGNPDAQYGMGVLCYRGKAVERDYVQAWKWFKLAADQGHAEAAQQLPSAEAKLLPEELEEARALAAAFQPGVPADAALAEAEPVTLPEPVIEPVAEPQVEPAIPPVSDTVPDTVVEPAVPDAVTPDPEAMAVVTGSPEIDTNAIHPNAPNEVVEEDAPELPGYPPLHGQGDPAATADDAMDDTSPVNALPTTAPPEGDGNLPGGIPADEPVVDQPAATPEATAVPTDQPTPAEQPGPVAVEPVAEPATEPATAPATEPATQPLAAEPVAPGDQADTGDLGASLPTPGLGAVPGAGSEHAPATEPAADPATTNALPTTAAPTASNSNLPLGAVEEKEYIFYYPDGFSPIEDPNVEHAYADPSGQASLDVVVRGVGGAEGRLELDLCRQISGMLMAELMQQSSGGGMGLGGMGGDGPKIEVQPVKPPTLEDVGPDLQLCSFAFAHNADGPWKVIEQHLYYKLKVPKLYTVTMRLLQGSGQDEVMRPAFEAFQVR